MSQSPNWDPLGVALGEDVSRHRDEEAHGFCMARIQTKGYKRNMGLMQGRTPQKTPWDRGIERRFGLKV